MYLKEKKRRTYKLIMCFVQKKKRINEPKILNKTKQKKTANIFNLTSFFAFLCTLFFLFISHIFNILNQNYSEKQKQIICNAFYFKFGHIQILTCRTEITNTLSISVSLSFSLIWLVICARNSVTRG